MAALTKLIGFGLIVLAAILFFQHGAAALRPTLPKNMPATSQFVVSGYDLQHNEPKGDWIACRSDVVEQANFCRVTDSHGMVIFQGNFLPVSGHRAVSDANLRISSPDLSRMFVKGPAEGSLVPVIPLASGEVLVPAADSIALADRWAKDPDELQRLQAQ